jgi:hypothetical protein
MDIRKKIYEFYHENQDLEMLDINYLYFETLYKKYQENFSVNIVLKDKVNRSLIIPLPIASTEDEKLIEVQDYEKLPEKVSANLKDYCLEICKMQAGLGTSVKRNDLIRKYSNREKLGSKGSDLFVNHHGKFISIAEAQLLLAIDKHQSGTYSSISFLNLINSETEEAVNAIWGNRHPESNTEYNELFKSEKLKRKSEVNQYMMPTINSVNEITFDRMAPAGHAFLGFFEILNIFRCDDVKNELMVIGNGEDLRSTPDEKILSWVTDNEIPITMITTTKLEKDKKGGQIAIVKEERSYVTIVEKAQAERAAQLEYFESLGLRDGDKRSLFNTNIVIINKNALKKNFNECLNLTEKEFREILSPDLIKNSKIQDGKEFIQLEGAIGSTILNLDKYFRQEYSKALVSFLNLAPESREKFFMPIKKREDFDDIYS